MNGIGFLILILLCAGAVLSACYPWEIPSTRRKEDQK